MIPQRRDSFGSKRVRERSIMMVTLLTMALLLIFIPISHHYSVLTQHPNHNPNHNHLNILSRWKVKPSPSSAASSSSSSRKKKKDSSSLSSSLAKKKVKELCSKTQYPDVCMRTLNGSSPNDTSIQLTSIAAKSALRHVKYAFHLSSQLSKQKGGHFMETAALLDCFELMDYTRDEVSTAIDILSSLDSSSSPSILERDLKTIKFHLSSSLGLQTACSDGCSSFHPGARSKRLLSDQNNLSKLVANSISLVKSLRKSATKTNRNFYRRHLLPATSEQKEEHAASFSLEKNGYPEWLSTKDRKLLQAPASSVSADAIVAQDGTAQYTTIQGAVDSIPRPYLDRYIIYIKAGVYKENVTIAKKYINLMLLGDGINRTIITGNRNVALQNYTTYRSATVALAAPGFMAKGITFQNTAGPQGHQAVAIRVHGDMTLFDSCSFEGYQDTLYALASRQFYRNCDIYGTVDYIFGNAIAVFQNCNLYARRPLKGQQNIYTAQGRIIADDPSGYSFQNCSLLPSDDLANSSYNISTYLGRPWKQYSRTVFMHSYLGSLVNVQGWLPWNSSNPYTNTLYYGEYQNTGPGSSTTKRVTWSGVHSNMSFEEAAFFSPDNFISAFAWLPNMGVSYQELS